MERIGDSVFGFEGMIPDMLARWLSWLERRPVTAEVVGSSPIRVVLYGEIWVICNVWCHTPLYMRDLSSAGRASALQAEGHRFEPYRSHAKSARRIWIYVPIWLNWQSS